MLGYIPFTNKEQLPYLTILDPLIRMMYEGDLLHARYSAVPTYH